MEQPKKLVFLNGYDQSRCVKKTNKTQIVLFFFNILGLVSALKSLKKPKINLEFLLLSWLIISIQQKHVFFFVFSISKPKQNRKNLGNTKKWVRTKHYLICFVFLDLWFCSFLFLFVHWFTWLPSVSLCFLTITAQIYWNIEVQKCPPWAPLLWDIVFPVVLYMPLYAPPKQKTQLVISIKKASR